MLACNTHTPRRLPSNRRVSLHTKHNCAQPLASTRTDVRQPCHAQINMYNTAAARRFLCEHW
jgi:hypothetical protein